MAAVTAPSASTVSVSQPDSDAEPADRFPLVRLIPDIRVMIWNAAMPDFAPCHFCLHCEGDFSKTTLTLIADHMTKAQRMPITTLSSVCQESRNEVVLKYPDLLPLHAGNFMRFSSSKDVVLLTTIKIESFGPVLPSFHLTEPPTMDTVIHFPFEWNAQVQNIAFKPTTALERAGIGALCPEMIGLLAVAMEPRFNFLNLFPRVKNYFSKHTVVCASETLEAVRKEWEMSIQMYVELEFASPEHIPSPGNPVDCTETLRVWRESNLENTATFLRDRKKWSAAIDNILDHMMNANTQHDTENRALVTRLRGINYSTMVGFWKYH
ncbi:hypothetical protein INS49_010009 [Diaporthe citri]|uniref:uncharacterized protein n=1 Tax=Diaporthe citri TaxID=83186 RepID=UPI001C81EA0D|nr:uncharacterized protein INS49_010009 [Diaporthe citri]KAG6361780.1 hypothetical protein INS49_010009 [Diaporthe citri]